jgi:membrane protein
MTTSPKNKIKILTLLGNALEEFRNNDPLRMAGATAFFTTFALPAILLILIQVFGLVLTPRFMARQLFHNLGLVIGKNTAGEMREILFNVRLLFRNWYEAIFGFLFLIFVATTLLKVIKDSLNQLWNIRTVRHLGFKFEILNRTKAFLVILVAGLLFMVVLLFDGGVSFVRQDLQNLAHPGIQPIDILRQIVSFILVATWFSLLFKFLPDGRPSWKTVFAGGTFTGLLFTLGKLLLQWLLTYSNMKTIYGASTSSVLLLLFVFYSSFIFYYGACFTKVWAAMHKKPIQPAKHAEKYEWSEVRQTTRH